MSAINNRIPWLEPTAAYIHVPFCAHHCGYCDFAVAAGHDQFIDLYIDAVGVELSSLGPAPADAGPSFSAAARRPISRRNKLGCLLEHLRRWLPLEEHGEFSIESTPESITAEKMEVLAAFGVTRVSIGVQSFHSHLLPVLDRIHGPEHVAPAVENVRRRGLSLSLEPHLWRALARASTTGAAICSVRWSFGPFTCRPTA